VFLAVVVVLVEVARSFAVAFLVLDSFVASGAYRLELFVMVLDSVSVVVAERLAFPVI
jgi:hypothetical protein